MEVIIDNRETKIKEYYNEKIANDEKLDKMKYSSC